MIRIVVAVLAGILAMSVAHDALGASAIFADTGDWITRADTGERICRVRYPLQPMMILRHDFCEWVGPAMSPSMTLPVEAEGWVRRGAHGGLQIHVEGKGWRP